MSQLGYIHTVRGKNGGMKLGLEPEAIGIGALVRKVEPDMSIVECFMDNGCCRVEPGCRLSGVLSEALSAFLAVLDKYTLADLLANPKGLSSLLGVEFEDLSNPVG